MNNIQEIGYTNPANFIKQAQKRVDQPNIFDQGKTDSVSFSGAVPKLGKFSNLWKRVQELLIFESNIPKLPPLEKFSNKLKVILIAPFGASNILNPLYLRNETLDLMSKNPKAALANAKKLLQHHKYFFKANFKNGFRNSNHNNTFLLSSYDLVGRANEKLGKTGQAFLNYAKGYKTYLKAANRDEATPIFKKMASRMIKMAEEGNKPDLANKIKAEVKKYSAKY
ncbi:MAG: hypothetical protein A2104_09600 [Candidatus Melainabacteria bacterium GWF2_32_7]|nr:MAG: hypothetical protein A2104_09600 [Candidatus Melainabacteria bacterium GWF2_32_7]